MGFIQVPPDSTGKLVDTVIVGGQHRETIAVGDPTTAAALGSVVRTPNADTVAGNPTGASGLRTALVPVTSYAPLIAGTHGVEGKVLVTDPSGRLRVAAGGGGELFEQMLAELRRITAAVRELLEPYGSRSTESDLSLAPEE